MLFGGSTSALGSLEARITLMELFWKFGSDGDVISDGWAPTDALKWEVGFPSQLRSEDVSSYHALPLKNRLLVVRNNVFREHWAHYSPDELKYLINRNCRLLQRDIPDSVREGVSLIHTCALALGSMFAFERPWTFVYWNELAREIVLASTNDHLHTVEECTIYGDSWTGTPLTSLFHGLAIQDRDESEQRACFSLGLKNWLEQLNQCGIDLMQYGRREKAYHSRHVSGIGGSIRVTFKFGNRTYAPMELCDFEFGPKPDDWVIRWSLDTCQMVGEFLEMIETQATSMSLDGEYEEYEEYDEILWRDMKDWRGESLSCSMPGEWPEWED